MMAGSILLVALVINAWTMMAFWWDKRRAFYGGRRVSERHLLGLALVGGSPAALLARRAFRHKTLKQPFTSRLHAIVAVQLLVGLAFVVMR